MEEELDDGKLKDEIDEIFERINNIVTNFEKHDPVIENGTDEKEKNINQIQDQIQQG